MKTIYPSVILREKIDEYIKISLRHACSEEFINRTKYLLHIASQPGKKIDDSEFEKLWYARPVYNDTKWLNEVLSDHELRSYLYVKLIEEYENRLEATLKVNDAHISRMQSAIKTLTGS